MVKPKKVKKLFKIEEIIIDKSNVECTRDEIAINRPCPGYRADNSWHLYEPTYLKATLSDEKEDTDRWNNTIFLDKSYWGYYCWPSSIQVNANQRSQEINKHFAEAIKPVAEKFRDDPEFFKKFIKLATIEESKGNEQFDKKKFYLFKALFRNYGTIHIINNLFEHLNALVRDRQSQTHECSHKLAAEIVCGLIRGSKYWPLAQLKQMWSQLKLIFDLIIENVSTETLVIWLDCFSNSFVN